jgi:hypothetical protein
MTGADRRLSRTGHFAMDFRCVTLQVWEAAETAVSIIFDLQK